MKILKYLRLNDGTTQCGLEKKSGIRRWKLALAENGHRILTEKEQQALGKIFNVDHSTLLTEIDLASNSIFQMKVDSNA